MTKEQIQQFESLTHPLVSWMNENFTPQTMISIDPTAAILTEGAIDNPAEPYSVTVEQLGEFEEMARPIIKWLNDSFHPHMQVTIFQWKAFLTEGVCGFTTEEYCKD